MKAAYINETGPSEVIKIGDLPQPQVDEQHVLVNVEAVAVNPIDTYIRSGSYKLELPLPFIIGRDMVGTVVDVGASANQFKRGDKVWCNNQGYAGRQGTFAEYVSIDQQLLYHLPPGVAPINALASVHSALTSVLGLSIKAQLSKGETLFINGGSGNVGTCATQLAKSMGATVIVTAGSDDKAAYCKECGADAVVNYKKENLIEGVRKHAPSGVEVYWDLTRSPDAQTALNLVKDRGRILLSSGMAHETKFKVGDFYTHNISMFGFTITNLNVEELAEYAEIINKELVKSTFSTRIARTLSLDEAVLSHQLLEKDDTVGKVVILISASA